MQGKGDTQGNDMLWDIAYIVEILTPKKREADPAQEDMERFARRYLKALESGCAVSIPDNPLGNLRHSALDIFDGLGLRIDPERTLLNLNTYHSKNELDQLLEKAAQRGVRYLLVIRGDGSSELPKLQPADLGVEAKMITSIELIEYINRSCGDVFCTGAAFNQYKPASVELKKLARKKSAGARFIITQPVMGRDERVSRLMHEGIPVILEAWMSNRVDIFLRSVKGSVAMDLDDFDPVRNLRLLHEAHPRTSVYLSMLHFDADWSSILPRL
jgi:methylenetetrahydrofolate reductase (NADPH)